MIKKGPCATRPSTARKSGALMYICPPCMKQTDRLVSGALYGFDGQNVFDSDATYGKSWDGRLYRTTRHPGDRGGH